MAAGAAIATRYAVRTSAGLSRRAPRTVALFWAAAAVVAFGWWAIFSQRGLQSWPIVAGEFCIPLVAAAGALVRIERPMPHVGRWALAVVLVSVIVLPLLLPGVKVDPWAIAKSLIVLMLVPLVFKMSCAEPASRVSSAEK